MQEQWEGRTGIVKSLAILLRLLFDVKTFQTFSCSGVAELPTYPGFDSKQKLFFIQMCHSQPIFCLFS